MNDLKLVETEVMVLSHLWSPGGGVPTEAGAGCTVLEDRGWAQLRSAQPHLDTPETTSTWTWTLHLMYVLFIQILMTLMIQNIRKSIIHSQIIRKLNPRKSPRMPPQSATRESRGKASISLLTRIFSNENTGHNLNPVVPSYGMYTLGFSLICKILTCLHVRNKITRSKRSIDAKGEI